MDPQKHKCVYVFAAKSNPSAPKSIRIRHSRQVGKNETKAFLQKSAWRTLWRALWRATHVSSDWLALAARRVFSVWSRKGPADWTWVKRFLSHGEKPDWRAEMRVRQAESPAKLSRVLMPLKCLFLPTFMLCALNKWFYFRRLSYEPWPI